MTWPIRLAFLFGVLLWIMRVTQQEYLLRYSYFHFKHAFALALLAFAEMSPRALSAGKRGAATGPGGQPGVRPSPADRGRGRRRTAARGREPRAERPAGKA